MQDRFTKRLRIVLSLGLLAILVVILPRLTRADDTPPVQPTTRPLKLAAVDDAKRDVILPTQPGDHRLKFRCHVGDRAVALSYLLHLPPDYNNPAKKHPMLVFFHGIGECGTDLAGVYALGPMTLLKIDGGNPTFAASCPFIVLCPQCPPRGETWDTDFIYKAAAQLIDQTIKKTRTDPDRVYATGLSMGGLGTWCVAAERPDLFAAIAPLSAMAWRPDDVGSLLRYISIWDVVGNDDEARFVVGTKSMETALANGSEARRFLYMLGMGHEAWYPPYQNPPFYEWFLEHRRPTAEQKKKLDEQGTPPAVQSLPSAPGHYLLSFKTKIDGQPVDLEYVLYLPKNYQPKGPASPTMLFLHEEDTMGPEYHDICMHGPDLALERNPALQNNFPFVVISPKLPIKYDWLSQGMTQMLQDLLDHAIQGLNIDADRISVTGINAGAMGAWKLASEAKDRFAAIVPIVTDGPLMPGDEVAKLPNAIPGRVFIKSNVNGSVDHLNQLIHNARQDWRLIKLTGKQNAIGNVPAYNDAQFINWLQEQRRSTLKGSDAVKQ